MGRKRFCQPGRQSPIAVILLAQARREVARAVVVADDVVAVLVAKVALVLVLVLAIPMAISTAMIFVSMSIVVTMIVVAVFAAVSLGDCRIGGKREAGGCGCEQQCCKMASIQGVSFRGGLT